MPKGKVSAAPVEEPPFWREEMQALRNEFHEWRKLNRELLDVLRDVRDELAYAREERQKRAANGHAGTTPT